MEGLVNAQRNLSDTLSRLARGFSSSPLCVAGPRHLSGVLGTCVIHLLRGLGNIMTNTSLKHHNIDVRN